MTTSCPVTGNLDGFQLGYCTGCYLDGQIPRNGQFVPRNQNAPGNPLAIPRNGAMVPRNTGLVPGNVLVPGKGIMVPGNRLMVPGN